MKWFGKLFLLALVSSIVSNLVILHLYTLALERDAFYVDGIEYNELERRRMDAAGVRALKKCRQEQAAREAKHLANISM